MMISLRLFLVVTTCGCCLAASAKNETVAAEDSLVSVSLKDKSESSVSQDTPVRDHTSSDVDDDSSIVDDIGKKGHESLFRTKDGGGNGFHQASLTCSSSSSVLARRLCHEIQNNVNYQTLFPLPVGGGNHSREEARNRNSYPNYINNGNTVQIQGDLHGSAPQRFTHHSHYWGIAPDPHEQIANPHLQSATPTTVSVHLQSSAPVRPLSQQQQLQSQSRPQFQLQSQLQLQPEVHHQSQIQSQLQPHLQQGIQLMPQSQLAQQPQPQMQQQSHVEPEPQPKPNQQLHPQDQLKPQSQLQPESQHQSVNHPESQLQAQTLGNSQKGIFRVNSKLISNDTLEILSKLQALNLRNSQDSHSPQQYRIVHVTPQSRHTISLPYPFLNHHIANDKPMINVLLSETDDDTMYNGASEVKSHIGNHYPNSVNPFYYVPVQLPNNPVRSSISQVSVNSPFHLLSSPEMTTHTRLTSSHSDSNLQPDTIDTLTVKGLLQNVKNQDTERPVRETPREEAKLADILSNLQILTILMNQQDKAEPILSALQNSPGNKGNDLQFVLSEQTGEKHTPQLPNNPQVRQQITNPNRHSRPHQNPQLQHVQARTKSSLSNDIPNYANQFSFALNSHKSPSVTSLGAPVRSSNQTDKPPSHPFVMQDIGVIGPPHNSASTSTLPVSPSLPFNVGAIPNLVQPPAVSGHPGVSSSFQTETSATHDSLLPLPTGLVHKDVTSSQFNGNMRPVNDHMRPVNDHVRPAYGHRPAYPDPASSLQDGNKDSSYGNLINQLALSQILLDFYSRPKKPEIPPTTNTDISIQEIDNYVNFLNKIRNTYEQSPSNAAKPSVQNDLPSNNQDLFLSSLLQPGTQNLNANADVPYVPAIHGDRFAGIPPNSPPAPSPAAPPAPPPPSEDDSSILANLAAQPQFLSAGGDGSSYNNVRDCLQNKACALFLAGIIAAGATTALAIPVLTPLLGVGLLGKRRRRRDIHYFILTPENSTEFVDTYMQLMHGTPVANLTEDAKCVFNTMMSPNEERSKAVLDDLMQYILRNNDKLLNVTVHEVETVYNTSVSSDILDHVKNDNVGIHLDQLKKMMSSSVANEGLEKNKTQDLPEMTVGVNDDQGGGGERDQLNNGKDDLIEKEDVESKDPESVTPLTNIINTTYRNMQNNAATNANTHVQLANENNVNVQKDNSQSLYKQSDTPYTSLESPPQIQNVFHSSEVASPHTDLYSHFYSKPSEMSHSHVPEAVVNSQVYHKHIPLVYQDLRYNSGLHNTYIPVSKHSGQDDENGSHFANELNQALPQLGLSNRYVNSHFQEQHERNPTYQQRWQTSSLPLHFSDPGVDLLRTFKSVPVEKVSQVNDLPLPQLEESVDNVSFSRYPPALPQGPPRKYLSDTENASPFNRIYRQPPLHLPHVATVQSPHDLQLSLPQQSSLLQIASSHSLSSNGLSPQVISSGITHSHPLSPQIQLMPSEAVNNNKFFSAKALHFYKLLCRALNEPSIPVNDVINFIAQRCLLMAYAGLVN